MTAVESYSSAPKQTQLQKETKSLERDVLRMGALVENSFHLAHQALFDRDLAAARAIALQDKQIDRFYRQIELDCAAIMTLKSPVAQDLRLVSALMQLVRDLERIGDYSKDLAEIALKNFSYPPHPCMPQIELMSHHAQAMLASSLAALVNLNAEAGLQVKQLDNTVDTAYEEIYLTLAHQRDIKGVVEPILLLALVIRHLERMADHATNIGQRVAYIVTGRRV
ncbi:MAG: phosphate signaling complex protein PhoU [Cyanosarcina radialis HA8281-LM2]|jgi:phosphate transport system protein|nr:phosphate signaling complex protein PhoU [Cyanosarcina radialis HA8281-LM2]